MPDGVVEAVERMALAKQQPLIGNGAPLFEWSPGVIINDNEEVVVIQDGDEAAEFIEETGIEFDEGDDQGANEFHEEEDQEGANEVPLPVEPEPIQAPVEIEDDKAKFEEEASMAQDHDGAQDEELRSEDNAPAQDEEPPDEAADDDIWVKDDTCQFSKVEVP